jgi:hypothetical protein
MDRTTAIREDNAALDDLARLSRALRTIDALIIYFRQQPPIVRELHDIKVLLLIQKSDALARRRAAGEYI